jgi:hypothetical protein
MSFSATGRLTRRSTSLGPKLLETWSAAMIGPEDGTVVLPIEAEPSKMVMPKPTT